MGKVLRISLILITTVLSFYSLSFGDQLAKGISLTKSSSELTYGKWILNQKEEPYFSSPEKAVSGSNFFEANPSRAIQNQEFSLNPEITSTTQSPATTQIQKKDLPHFENSQLSKGKYSYHFGKIYPIKNNPDSSLDFISSLSSAQYKEENPLSWTLERFKENDIFKSLAILLELKLNF